MAYYSLAELVITDGTELIDLLNNFNLADWQPDVLKYRDGGIYQDSPLADGRRLVQKYYGNMVESFTLAVRAGRMDSAITDLRRLRQLMENSASYWDEGSETPVWIEARGTGETNRRYSIILGWAQDRDPNPYSMPFAGRLETIGIVQLNIEHSFWMDKKPENYTLTAISAVVEDADGGLWGNVDNVNARQEVTDGGCFVGNCDPAYRPSSKVNQVNAVIFATAPALFVGNRQKDYPFAWPAPVQLMPNTMVAGDGLFFATAASPSTAGTLGSVPFGSLVFDISTPGANYTAEWYYSIDDGMGGDTWALLEVNDQTDTLKNAGVGLVTFNMPTNWKPIILFGEADARYWITMSISATAGGKTGPYQQNRNVYTVNWPYAEVQAGTIEGDIPAVMSFRSFTPTYFDPQNGDPATIISPYRIVLGLYSKSFSQLGVSSDFFSPYLGLVDGQVPYNPTSQSKNGAGGTAGTQAFTDSPYQENLVFDTAIDGASVTIIVEPESAALSVPASRWFGRFKAFLRYGQDGAAGATANYFTAQLRVGGSTINGQSYGTPDRAVTDVVPLAGVKNWSIAEFGSVDTRGGMKQGETGVTFFIDIEASADAVTANAKLYLFDLVLIPVEEWSADISVDASVTLGMLAVDAILFPRRGLRAVSFVPDGLAFDDPVMAGYEVGVFQGNSTASISSSGVPILQKQVKQRLFFLTINQTTSNNDAPISYPWTVTEVGLYHVLRYHSMRGKS